MVTKELQIQEKLQKTFEVKDRVVINIPYRKTSVEIQGKGKNKTTVEKVEDLVYKENGSIVKIDESYIHVSVNRSMPYELSERFESYYINHDRTYKISSIYLSHTFNECGSNPFTKEKRRISFYNQDIQSVLFKAGYGRKSESDFNNPEPRFENIEGVNFNPYIIDAEGNQQFYQRGLVWTQEQKQLLLESIYNGIEIGKFLFRYNPWARIETEVEKTGTGYSFDCVDGKQRFFAILEFLQNKYPDAHGNYWKDLSSDAQRRFLNYGNLSYGELPESASDEDVIDNFLTLNFTGTPMSQEHIDYVKSFNIKK